MPIAAGIITAIATWILIAVLIGPAMCRDGWRSPSIGRQGACSHHGGVSRNGPIGLLAVVAGIGAYFATKYLREDRAPPLTENQSCPLCGKPMRPARGREGWLLICSQFPNCRGW